MAREALGRTVGRERRRTHLVMHVHAAAFSRHHASATARGASLPQAPHPISESGATTWLGLVRASAADKGRRRRGRRGQGLGHRSTVKRIDCPPPPRAAASCGSPEGCAGAARRTCPLYTSTSSMQTCERWKLTLTLRSTFSASA